MQAEIIRNDISTMKADAIVLPANRMLREGSGTSTALFEKAGRSSLEKACRETIKRYKKRIYIGEAVPTLAFNLDADYIIHAIVPKWKDGNSHEYELLSSAYFSSLKLADMLGCGSVAIPLLASGNNGFDYKLAFKIAKESIEAFKPTNKLKTVYLVLYGMHITSYVREQGIPVTEYIDQKYVLSKNEKYLHPAVKVLQSIAEKGKTIGIHVGKYVVEDAVDMAMEYFEDPDNRKKLLNMGAQIAGKILAAKVLLG